MQKQLTAETPRTQRTRRVLFSDRLLKPGVNENLHLLLRQSFPLSSLTHIAAPPTDRLLSRGAPERKKQRARRNPTTAVRTRTSPGQSRPRRKGSRLSRASRRLRAAIPTRVRPR